MLVPLGVLYMRIYGRYSGAGRSNSYSVVKKKCDFGVFFENEGKM